MLSNIRISLLDYFVCRFVVDIYRDEGRKEDKKAVSQIPFLIPKVIVLMHGLTQKARTNFPLSDYQSLSPPPTSQKIM